jgi:hypothetical protein
MEALTPFLGSRDCSKAPRGENSSKIFIIFWVIWG